MDNAPPYVIEMLHITKEFPGIKANDDITLQLKKGEIHALLGENGAGKSTLMSVLFGLYQPEAGEIRKNGKPVKIDNPNDATALGIVHLRRCHERDVGARAARLAGGGVDARADGGNVFGNGAHSGWCLLISRPARWTGPCR